MTGLRTEIPAILPLVLVALAAGPAAPPVGPGPAPLAPVDASGSLLETRDRLWRAWFSGDREALNCLLAPEFTGLNAGETTWSGRAEVIAASAVFTDAGGKLVEIAFPDTAVRTFGDVALVHSTYRVRFEQGGRLWQIEGRATHAFVIRDGQWSAVAWHLENRG